MGSYGSYIGSGGSSFDFSADHIYTGTNTFSAQTILGSTSISGGTFLVANSANTFTGGSTAFISGAITYNGSTIAHINTINTFTGGSIQFNNTTIRLYTTTTGLVTNLYLGKSDANKIEIGNYNSGVSSSSYGYINSYYGTSTPTYLSLNTNNTGLTIGSNNQPETGVMIQKQTKSSLGIYAADSSSKLFFEAYNGNLAYFGTLTPTSIFLQTSNVNRVIFHSNGRIGIKKLADDTLGQLQLDGIISYYNAVTNDATMITDTKLIVYCDGQEYLIDLKQRLI